MKTTVRRSVAFGLLGTLAIGGLATAMGEGEAPKAHFIRPSTKAIRELAGRAGGIKFGKEKKHGIWVFTGEWRANGVSHEAMVTADGTVVETEESVSLKHVPTAVRAAIAEHFGSDVKVTVEKKTIIIYEAEAEINGREMELLIFPTGKVHEQEHDGDKDDAHEGHDHGDQDRDDDQDHDDDD